MEHHRPWKKTNEPAESDDSEPPSPRRIIHPFNSLRRYLEIKRSQEISRSQEMVPSPEDIHFHGEAPDEDILFKTTVRQIIEENFAQPPHVLYNPGCGHHVSLASVIPEARTIFVDEDEFTAEDFLQYNKDHREQPFEFYRADMHSFRLPENLRADVVLIVNVECMTEAKLRKITNQHGIIIANNRNSAAEYMLEHCPNYALIKKYSYQNPELDLHAFRRKY